MAATSKYHITLESSAGVFGFLTKRFSSRQKPDSLFGSRFSTGDITYSTMNRWQRFAQTTWIGGAFQKYLEDKTKFRLSRDVDILSHGEIKLSRKLSTAKHAGASPILKAIRFNGATYWIEGQYIKYTVDAYAHVATSKDFGSAEAPTDLAIFNGELWAAVGDFGLWHHDTSDHTTWAEQLDTAATVPCNYLQAWGDNLYLTYTNKFISFDASAFTEIKDFATGGDSVYFLKKPVVYARSLFVPINISSTEGAGELWEYTGTTFDVVFTGLDPIGQEAIVYNSLLIFVVYGLEKASIKAFNGSTSVTMQSFDVLPGTTVYGTGLRYGTDALYGAGSDKYSDPVSMIVWRDFLVICIKRTATQNTLLIYDTIGWTEYLSLPVGASYYASMWLEERELFVGGSDGDIYKVEDAFSATGYVQGSLWDADLQDITKLFADIVIKHDPLQTGDSIDVWYRSENETGFVFLGSATTVGATKSTIAFPTGASTVKSSSLEYKVVLNSGAGTTSPVIKDIVIRYILSPENDKRVFEYTIEATKKMKLLDGTFETLTPAQIISALWALKTSGELLTLVDENAESHSVVFSDTTPEIVTPFVGDDVLEKYVYIRLFEL